MTSGNAISATIQLLTVRYQQPLLLMYLGKRI